MLRAVFVVRAGVYGVCGFRILPYLGSSKLGCSLRVRFFKVEQNLLGRVFSCLKNPFRV